MKTEAQIRETLERSIREHHSVRLVYRRQRDELLSIHEVAPIDIRGGWTEKTASTLYLWAWCLAERQGEMHIMKRVVDATMLAHEFDPADLLESWPSHRWPLPDSWRIPRSW